MEVTFNRKDTNSILIDKLWGGGGYFLAMTTFKL